MSCGLLDLIIVRIVTIVCKFLTTIVHSWITALERIIIGNKEVKNIYCQRYFISFISSLCALTISIVAGFISFLVGTVKKNDDCKNNIVNIHIIQRKVDYYYNFHHPHRNSGCLHSWTMCIPYLPHNHVFYCLSTKFNSGKTTKEEIKNIQTSEQSDKVLWFGSTKTLFDPR